MIKKKLYMVTQDNIQLYRTYSDEGYYIKQVETGIEYEEAIDVENAPYTYEETNKLIEIENENEIV